MDWLHCEHHCVDRICTNFVCFMWVDFSFILWIFKAKLHYISSFFFFFSFLFWVVSTSMVELSRRKYSEWCTNTLIWKSGKRHGMIFLWHAALCGILWYQGICTFHNTQWVVCSLLLVCIYNALLHNFFLGSFQNSILEPLRRRSPERDIQQQDYCPVACKGI